MTLKNLFANGRNILSRKQTNILSAAFVLGFAFTISALLGILRDRFLYAQFYSCCADQLDAYNAAFRIPDIIFKLLVIGALSAAFIPVFSGALEENKKQAYSLARSTITLLFVIFFVISVVVFIFAKPLSSLITADFSLDQINLMARLTRVMLAAQLFFLISNFLTGILQVNKRFLVPAFSPVVYNLGIILGIVSLSPFLGIYGPAVGVLIGAFFHFAIQLPQVASLGFKLKPEFSFSLPGVKRIVRLMIPRSLSLGLGEIESTVVLFLATSLPTGSLSLLYLAQHLGSLPSRLFGATIGQAALPALSASNSRKDYKEFTKILVDSFLQALYLTIPVAVAILVLRIPIIRLAFGTRGFPWQATLKTGQALAYLAPGIVAQSGIQIMTRGFYSLQDTKTPFWVAVISLLISVVIGVLSIHVFDMGILGLVLAISLASIFQFIVLFCFISKKVVFFPWQRMFSFLGKVGISASISGTVSWLVMRYFDLYLTDTSRVFGLILLTTAAVFLGLVFYLLSTLIFKVEEAKAYLNLIKKLGSFRQIIKSSGEQIKKQKEVLESSTGF
jgi:putative peptidoglycan lipid II flippase